MKIIKGISASTGIAIGRCCMYKEEVKRTYQSYNINENQANNELIRLKEAKLKAISSMKRMVASSENLFDSKSSAIYKSHLMILQDASLYEKIENLIKNKLINAEHAVNDVFEEYIAKISSKPLHFADLKHDLVDIKNRFLESFGSLTGKFECSAASKEAVIVVAKRLTPSLIMSLPRENVLAFITNEGGFTTHATILARNMKVPVIFGVDTEKHLNCGDYLIVDGTSGKVIYEPDSETKAKYLKKVEAKQNKKLLCDAKLAHEPKTAVGARILLKVNISTPGELDILKGIRYDGIGLLRTEFLFSNRPTPPSEDEQFKLYRLLLEKNASLPMNIRLLDISTDKLPGFVKLPKQENPDLGIRGARALELFKDIYMDQIKAVLRASAYGDIRILLPMIADIVDFDEFLNFIDNAKAVLNKNRAGFNKNIKIGAMIETPSAALLADKLMKIADFANIGSNDLLQYTLASSRGNVEVEKRYHILHPALIKLMRMAVEAGDSYNKEVCLCGEIASFDEYYPLLIGIGIKSFSISAAKFDDVKCEIHNYYGKTSDELLNSFNKVNYRHEIDSLFST